MSQWNCLLPNYGSFWFWGLTNVTTFLKSIFYVFLLTKFLIAFQNKLNNSFSLFRILRVNVWPPWILFLSGIIHINIFWVLSKYKQKKKNINTSYSYKYQSTLPFVVTFHNNNLFWSLHLLANSDLLFKK